MNYFYDTEFLEDGKTIELISIGIVADDGREYYAVNRDMPVQRIIREPWLVENVWAHLPLVEITGNEWDENKYSDLDRSHQDVKSKDVIAREVFQFLAYDGKPELWAWFAAYDHVALAQLWGKMIHMPRGLPQYTKDIRMLCDEVGQWTLPPQDGAEHNALEDARWNKRAYDFLRAVQKDKNERV